MAIEASTDHGYVQWQGNVHFSAGELSRQIYCRVLVSACPQKDLRIEVANEFGSAMLSLIGEKALSIKLPNVPDPIDLLLSGFSADSTMIPFRVRRGSIISQKATNLRRGRTLIVNLGPFWIPSVDSRFVLEGNGWRVDCVPVSEKMLSIRPELQSSEYKITHQVNFERIDESAFTPQDAENF